MNTAAAVLLLTGLSGPGPEPELLPAPTPLPTRRVVVKSPPVPPGVGFYRPAPSAVWQFYGVNKRGQFVPRVLETPHGAFAPPFGHPYPWTATHETSYLPFFTR